MTTIEELISLQKEFDGKHQSWFRWDEEISEKNIQVLEYLLLATLGELGEAANITKKVIRGDFSFAEAKERIGEEVIDVLIYALKLSYQLKLDVRSEYLKKMEKNKNRFQKYENGK